MVPRYVNPQDSSNAEPLHPRPNSYGRPITMYSVHLCNSPTARGVWKKYIFVQNHPSTSLVWQTNIAEIGSAVPGNIWREIVATSKPGKRCTTRFPGDGRAMVVTADSRWLSYLLNRFSSFAIPSSGSQVHPGVSPEVVFVTNCHPLHAPDETVSYGYPRRVQSLLRAFLSSLLSPADYAYCEPWKEIMAPRLHGRVVEFNLDTLAQLIALGCRSTRKTACGNPMVTT